MYVRAILFLFLLLCESTSPSDKLSVIVVVTCSVVVVQVRRCKEGSTYALDQSINQSIIHSFARSNDRVNLSNFLLLCLVFDSR